MWFKGGEAATWELEGAGQEVVIREGAVKAELMEWCCAVGTEEEMARVCVQMGTEKFQESPHLSCTVTASQHSPVNSETLCLIRLKNIIRANRGGWVWYTDP